MVSDLATDLSLQANIRNNRARELIFHSESARFRGFGSSLGYGESLEWPFEAIRSSRRFRKPLSCGTNTVCENPPGRGPRYRRGYSILFLYFRA